MNNVVLSVIIPVYNGKAYLQELIATFFEKNKELQNKIELIFVDDGSTDDSYEMLMALSNKHSNIKVFRKSNGGIASARNYGLLHAIGTFVTFMDQDDCLEKSYESFLQVMETTQSDVLISDFFVRGFNKQILSREMGITADRLLEGVGVKNVALKLLCGDLCEDAFLLNITVHPSVWNCIFRRETLNKHDCHFFSFVDYEDDWLFIIQSLMVSDRVVLTNKKYYCWNENLGSESHSVKYIPDLFAKKQALKAWIIKSLCQLAVDKKKRDVVAGRFEAHCLFECFYNSILNLSYKDYRKEMSQLEVLENSEMQSVNLPLVQQVFRYLLLHKCFFVAYLLNRYVLKRHFH